MFLLKNKKNHNMFYNYRTKQTYLHINTAKCEIISLSPVPRAVPSNNFICPAPDEAALLAASLFTGSKTDAALASRCADCRTQYSNWPSLFAFCSQCFHLHYWHELRFHVPLDTKWVISETFFPAKLLASSEETKPNTAEQTFARNTKILKKDLKAKARSLRTTSGLFDSSQAHTGHQSSSEHHLVHPNWCTPWDGHQAPNILLCNR